MLSMADCAYSSSNHHSSGVSAVSGGNSNSPQSRRGSLPSPWPEVARGEQEPTWVVRHSPPSSASLLSSLAMPMQEQAPFVDSSATQVAQSPLPLPLPPENSASAENSNENHVNTAARDEKPAWNKPSDGVFEVGPAMGAVASPALSESAEASPKFQDESSWRAATDASTSTQVPVNLLHPYNHVANNATPNSTTNHAMPIRQRFIPRAVHSGNGGGPPHREPSYPNNNWNPRLIGGYLPQPRPVNDHHGVSWRGNINPYMHRNSVSVHHNNENRAAHNRGSFFNGGNVHMHQQTPHARSCWGPSTSSPHMPPTNFFFPQPVRAYGNPMFYQVPFDAFPLEHYRGPQFMPQHPIIQSISEPSVSTLLVNQINYYFCDANLGYDNFLKSHMDDQGWVSIDLVASFPRVKKLTNDIRLILDSLRASTVVEVQGDKIRRRHKWINWIPNKNPTPALSPSESSQDLLTNVQNLKIEEAAIERGGDDNGKMKELPNDENTQKVDSRK